MLFRVTEDFATDVPNSQMIEVNHRFPDSRSHKA